MHAVRQTCSAWPARYALPPHCSRLLFLSALLASCAACPPDVRRVFLCACVACSGFKLTKCVGGIFFSMYFAFIAYSLLSEFGKIPF